MSAETAARTTGRLGRLRVASFRLLRGRGARHLGWGVADQGLSSLTNLAVTLSVARMLGAEQFGAFSLAYVTYGFALTASRGLATDPLMVRFGGADVPTWRRAVAGSSGTAAAVGLAASVCVLAVAAVTPGTAKQAFLALGLMLPALLIQDSWRYAFFAAGRGGQAFLNDMVWAMALLPALVLVWVSGHQNVFWFLFAWGSAAAVAAVFGLLQTRVLPGLSAAKRWLLRHRDLGFRYFAEGSISSGATQLRTYGVGLILGLAAVGYVQAAYTLMGPLMIMMFGTGAVIVPELARVLRRSPRHLPLVCLGYGGSLAAAALVWGAVLARGTTQRARGVPAGRGLGAQLPAGAVGHACVYGREHPSRRGGRATCTGSRTEEPAGDDPLLDRPRCLLPCRRTRRRNHRDSARCSGRSVDWCSAVVVATPCGAARLTGGTRAGPGVVRPRSRAFRSRPMRPPLVIATILREEGITGVHTHVRQLRRYLEECDETVTLVTPFSWSRTLAIPVFAPRLILQRCSGSADVAWYRHWHAVFLQKALRSALAEVGDCVVYAQCPLSARAALRARRGPHQRVVMAIHFSISQADEWAVKKLIKNGGTVFRAIRQVERETIPQVDGLVYVSRWAQNGLSELAPRSRGGAIVGHRQFRRAVAPGIQPGADRGSCDGRQSSASEEPPFSTGCPRSGEAGRTIPHPGRVRGGADAKRPPGTGAVTGPGRTGPFPWLPTGCARLPAALPCLRPRFVLRIFVIGDHRGDGCRPSHRGREHRAHRRVMRRRCRGSILVAR